MKWALISAIIVAFLVMLVVFRKPLLGAAQRIFPALGRGVVAIFLALCRAIAWLFKWLIKIAVGAFWLLIGRSHAGRLVRLGLLIVSGLITGCYFALQWLFRKSGWPSLGAMDPMMVGVATLATLLVIYLIYRMLRGRPSASTPTQTKTSTTPKSGSALKTIFVLVLLGAGGWFILKPVYEQSRARSAERERRKLPVTLACDPTRYNTELLSGRKANEWVTVYVQPGCEATEMVVVPEGRSLAWKTLRDTNIKAFGSDGMKLSVVGASEDGWFVDNPTKRYSINPTAIQLRNSTANLLEIRLRPL